MNRTDKAALCIGVAILLLVAFWPRADAERAKPERQDEFHSKESDRTQPSQSGAAIAHDRAELYAEAEEVMHMAANAITIYQNDMVQVSNIVTLVNPAVGLWLGPCGPEEHQKVAAIKAQLETLMKAKQESK